MKLVISGKSIDSKNAALLVVVIICGVTVGAVGFFMIYSIFRTVRTGALEQSKIETPAISDLSAHVEQAEAYGENGYQMTPKQADMKAQMAGRQVRRIQIKRYRNKSEEIRKIRLGQEHRQRQENRRRQAAQRQKTVRFVKTRHGYRMVEKYERQTPKPTPEKVHMPPLVFYTSQLSELLEYKPSLTDDPDVTFIFGAVNTVGFTFTTKHKNGTGKEFIFTRDYQ